MTTQHDEYYMQDGDVVFLVSGSLITFLAAVRLSI